MRRTEKIAYVNLYHDDFLTGIDELTPDERGVYLTICLRIWSRGGPLPDDDSLLSRWSNCSTRKFRTIKNALIEKGKIEVKAREIRQTRAELELEKALRTKDKARENGAEGGKKTAEHRQKGQSNQQNTGSDPMSFATSDPGSKTGSKTTSDPSSSQSQSQNQNKLASSSSVVPMGLLEEVLALAGLHRLLRDAAGAPGLLAEPGKILAEWTSAGLTRERIIAVVKSVVDRPGFKGVRSIGYFTSAMRDEAAKPAPKAEPDWVAMMPKGCKLDPKFLTDTDKRWLVRLGHFRENGQWIDTQWGPKPGEPGCCVPRYILVGEVAA